MSIYRQQIVVDLAASFERASVNEITVVTRKIADQLSLVLLSKPLDLCLDLTLLHSAVT